MARVGSWPACVELHVRRQAACDDLCVTVLKELNGFDRFVLACLILGRNGEATRRNLKASAGVAVDAGNGGWDSSKRMSGTPRLQDY